MSVCLLSLSHFCHSRVLQGKARKWGSADLSSGFTSFSTSMCDPWADPLVVFGLNLICIPTSSLSNKWFSLYGMIFLLFISKLGVLKTTLKYSDLVEGLTELSKAFILMFMVCCSKRIQIKISKGKKHLGQGAGETRHNFQLFFPSGTMQLVLVSLSDNVWQYAPSICTKETYPSPSRCTEFLLGAGHIDTANCPPGWP